MKNQTINWLGRFLAGTAGLCLLAACGEPEPEQAQVVRPVKILTIAGGAGGRTQEYAGVIQSGSTADLGFEVPGRIVELRVNEGQDVNRGDVLARLDAADYQSAVDQADADFRAAESTFRRYEELAATGAVSRQELDNQRRTFEVAVANRETAQKALADTNLRAPFSGNIGRTYVDNFTNVAAKEPVVLLQDIGSLEAVIAIPEQDWGRAKPGRTYEEVTRVLQPVATLTTFPGREFPLVFSEVATVADPVTRTYEIRMTLERPDDIAIMPGMTASVRITQPAAEDGDEQPIRLPSAAVFGNDSGGSSVWLVDPDTMTVSEVEVEVGEFSSDGVAVLAGLMSGDRVAISGVANLQEGMQVREYGP